jgi:Holliday junction resolvase RusA-like endonuclease
MEYMITPVPKPRQSRRDKWAKRKCVVEYRNFCDLCRAEKMELPVIGAHVTFVLPMPQSWSEKKRLTMDGKPHQQTPDLDNMCKALADALYGNDSVLWDVRITKVWGRTGKIIITDWGRENGYRKHC